MAGRSSVVPVLCALIVLLPQAIKVCTTITPLPRWDMDPLLVPGDMIGLGVASAAILDLITILGGAAALLFVPAMGGSKMRERWTMGLLLAGALLVTLLGIVRPLMLLHDQRIALAWVAGFVGGAALLRLATDARVRLVVMAAVCGLLVMMAAKGAMQMLYEHARVVESFRLNKESLFAAQGWTSDSSSAKGYERRLMQNEPSGWFGLANVFATFMAAGVGLAAAPCVAMLRSKRRGAAGYVVWGGLLVICMVGVIAAGSKGGLVVAAVAAVTGAAGGWRASGKWPNGRITKLPNSEVKTGAGLEGQAGKMRSIAGWILGELAGIIAVALVIGVNVGVLVRGMVGERIGELSVLFRWFYVEAAWRIFQSAWLTGVGPDGFKESYLRMKNPLSPEEVQSPHNIGWEWLATLGVGGGFLVLAVLVMAYLCGRGMWAARWSNGQMTKLPNKGRESGEKNSLALDGEWERWFLRRAVLVVPVGVTLVCLWLDAGGLPPEVMVMRIGLMAVTAWMGLKMCDLFGKSDESDEDDNGDEGDNGAAVLQHALVAGCGAFGLAILLQSQIEVTMSSTQAGPLAMMCLAIGAAGGVRWAAGGVVMSSVPATHLVNGEGGIVMHRKVRFSPGQQVGPALLVLLIAACAWHFAVSGMISWEGKLKAAAEVVRPLAETEVLMRDASRAKTITERDALMQEAAGLLKAAMAGGPAARPDVAATPQAVEKAMASLRYPLILRARDLLAEAMDQTRPDVATWREQSRLTLLLAQLTLATPGDASRRSAAGGRSGAGGGSGAGGRGEAGGGNGAGAGVLLEPEAPVATPAFGKPDTAARAEARELIQRASTASNWLMLRRPAAVTSWQVTVLRTALDMIPDERVRHALFAAISNAIQVDPFSLPLVMTQYRLLKTENPVTIDAANAAQRALEIHGLLRLDAEVKGLDERTRKELQRFVKLFEETGMAPVD